MPAARSSSSLAASRSPIPVSASPQRDQQPAPGLVFPGRPGQAEGGQGHLEQPGRFFVGQQRQRAAPGPLGVADRLAGLAGAAARRRLEEMVRQLGQVRVQVRPVKRLQGLTGLLVQPKPLPGRDGLIPVSYTHLTLPTN